ncbi:MAG TPA: hypothetical protein VLJ61_11070 [Pyrinomonadaceae bacterium]|nr:hypothetical protein [Pyrinomonadaceae bacterium]
MKNNYCLVAVLSLAVFSAAVVASPQPARSNFTAFWSQFKGAVARQDAAAVADMTKLPFTYEDKSLDRAAFITQYKKIFGGLKSCVAKEKPVRDGETYSIFCGEQGLLFQKAGGEYKFVEFFAND